MLNIQASSLPFVWIIHSSLQLHSHTYLKMETLLKYTLTPEEFIFNVLAFLGNYIMSYGNKNSDITMHRCLIFSLTTVYCYRYNIFSPIFKWVRYSDKSTPLLTFFKLFIHFVHKTKYYRGYSIKITVQ